VVEGGGGLVCLLDEKLREEMGEEIERGYLT
jgi:hypothetical protein